MNRLYVVGVGTGNYEDFTIKAVNTLNLSEIVYCDELTFNKIKGYFDQSKIVSNEYTKTKTRCTNAINSAKNGLITSIVGSGDTGIYGISNIIYQEMEKLDTNIEVEVVSGVTSAISGSSLLGSPLTQDFSIISLSDNLANRELIQTKIESIAQTNFVIVFYSPNNPTKENLLIAKEILLKYRSPKTIIGISSYIGEEKQSNIVTTLEEMPLEEISSFSTVFIGNNKTYMTKSKKMVTPL